MTKLVYDCCLEIIPFALDVDVPSILSIVKQNSETKMSEVLKELENRGGDLTIFE